MASSPELVLFNGNIHTQDAAHPHATAVAVGDGHILACGIDKDILALAGSATRTIDLAQRLVLPGFIDTHFHFYDWALNCNSIDFAPVTSFAGMEAAIREKTRALAPGQWILGQGFNESDWPENRMPHRRDLDRVAPDHPVCIWRCDLHLAVANSLALQLAGIDRHTPDPVGGIIEKDGNGVPTGVLKELAPNRIRAAVPELTREQLLSNLEKRMAQAHALGITGIHDVRLMEDANGGEALRAWQILQNREKLALRCMVTLPGEMTDQAVELGLCTGLGDDFLRIGHLKFFADGGMGARTAWVTEPYLDAPGMGMPLTPVAEIQRAVARADRAGLSCMVHAVGDRACREVLDIYARVAATGQSHCTIAHRVEHAQMILPQDLERLGRIPNLAVSCQPGQHEHRYLHDRPVCRRPGTACLQPQGHPGQQGPPDAQLRCTGGRSGPLYRHLCGRDPEAPGRHAP